MNRKTKKVVLFTKAASNAAGIDFVGQELSAAARRHQPDGQMEITVVDGVLTVYTLTEETDADRAQRFEAALNLAVLKLAAILDDDAELDAEYEHDDWLGCRAHERLYDIIAAIKENL
jgi:hypothetical protein